ncbi:CsgG/HfaB family protein [Gemmatimonadota bacterium]
MRPVFSRSAAPLICCLLLLPLLTTSCAHKKAYKRALQYEEDGRYLEAAEQDLFSLDRKPEFEPAKSHLRIIAPRAYTELIDRAAGFEMQNEWIAAIDTYDYTEQFYTRCSRHDVVLQASDVGHLRADAERRGTEYRYQLAEAHFNRREYELAIQEYLKVVAIAGYHEETRARLWRSHIEVGNQLIRGSAFEQAITEWYEPALEYAEFSTDEAGTRSLIAEAYYRWAEQLVADGDERGAFHRFERALAAVPGYRDAEERSREMYEEAVARVAIMPFRNATSFGFQYSNLLTEQLITHCISANLEFAVFATREHIEQLLMEHELTAAGAIDPSTASRIGELEGIDFFVSGSVTQISEQTSQPTFVERENKLKYTALDSTGKEVERTRSIFYREYTMRRTVEVAASYQIVDVETGRFVKGEDFSDRLTDEVNWIRYQGSINDLPRDKRPLLDAPTEPRSADMITNDGMRLLAEKMSEKILRFFR